MRRLVTSHHTVAPDNKSTISKLHYFLNYINKLFTKVNCLKINVCYTASGLITNQIILHDWKLGKYGYDMHILKLRRDNTLNYEE